MRQGISNNSETEAKESDLNQPLATEWKHAKEICIRHVETESTYLVHLPGKECLLQWYISPAIFEEQPFFK